MSRKFWYLGTPYSKYPHGLEAAFRLAVRNRGLLIKAGIPCFSPIVHSHPVAIQCDIDPLDLSIWLPCESPFLVCAHGLILLKAESWEISIGLKHEREECEAAGKPVIYMEEGIVPPELIEHG